MLRHFVECGIDDLAIALEASLHIGHFFRTLIHQQYYHFHVRIILLYASGDFTGALEKIDPSENYSGTALEGLDAYQLQLKRFDIKVS